MPEPYYADNTVTLYHGDMREVLPALGLQVDCVATDPPYGETGLAWDRWPGGWPEVVAPVASSMWCFGTLRMFAAHWVEFAAWRLSQDVVWRKHAGSRPANDRFVRVHEQVTHWYRGPWGDIYREVPRRSHHGPAKNWRPRRAAQAERSEHTGKYGPRGGYQDDGTRLMTSVLEADHRCQKALHPTEKPIGVLHPLIEYACPPGGTVLDPFAGSGATAEAARLSGRRAVLVEADERYCEVAARRLAQDVLPLGGR